MKKKNKKKHLEEDTYREYSSQSFKKLRTGSSVRRVQQSLLQYSFTEMRPGKMCQSMSFLLSFIECLSNK